MKRRIVSMGAVCVILTGLLCGCIGKDPYVCVEMKGDTYTVDDEYKEYSKQYTYDEQGNIVEERYYVEGELNSFTEYECDEKGNVLSEIQHDMNLEEVTKTEYEYDDLDRVITTRIYRGGYSQEDAYAAQLSNIEYDGEDRVEKILYTQRDFRDGSIENESMYTITYEYDTEDPGSRIEYLEGEKHSTSYFYYGDDGKLLESDKSIVDLHAWMVDRVPGCNAYIGSGDTTYEYDKDGNLIHTIKTVTINDESRELKADYKYMKLSDYLKTQDF